MDKISLDLKKIPDFLDARFKTNEIEDGLLEVENQHGFPKCIYVNDAGEIWTSKADGVTEAKTPEAAAKEIRSIVSKSNENLFKISDMMKLLPPATQQGQENVDYKPHLDENQILNHGSEVTKDILAEPEISSLGLAPQDQNQIAIMVFDVILDDKNKELANMHNHVAKKMASTLNEHFKNMFFVDNGDSIQVFFDSKVAGNQEFSKEQIEEVLKYAFSELSLVNFYNEMVADYIMKVSSKEPDYFRLRDIILNEVLEQINGKK